MQTNFKRLFGIALLLLVWIGNTNAQRYYWVGDGDKTSWSDILNWSSTSGGTGGAAGQITSAPSNTNTVVFNEYSKLINTGAATSQRIVAISGAVNCDSIIVENCSANTLPFFRIGNGNVINVYGSLLLQSGVTFNNYTNLTFLSSRSVETIQTNGASLYSSKGYSGTTINDKLIFNSNTTYQLADNLDCNGIQIATGKLDLNGKNINCQEIAVNAAGSIAFTGSIIDCRVRWNYNANAILTSAQTDNSLIRIALGTFATKNATDAYNNVEFYEGGGGTIPTHTIIRGTYNKITILKGAMSPSTTTTAGISDLTTDSLVISSATAIRFGADVVVKKYFEAKPAVCGGQVRLSSNSPTSPTTITTTGANVVIERAVIHDLNITPTANAEKSYNWGNTGGFTFNPTYSPDAGRDLYWTGGAGYWGDPLHWALNPDGSGSAGCIPTLADNVFFNAYANTGGTAIGSGSDTDKEKNGVKLDMDAWCNNMVWNGVPGTPYFVLRGGTSENHYCTDNLMIGGSLTLQSSLKITGYTENYTNAYSQTFFVSDRNTETITTNGCAIPSNFVFQSVNGTGKWKLMDNLVLYTSERSTAATFDASTGNYTLKPIYFNRGHLDFNGKKVVARKFVGAADNSIAGFSGLPNSRTLDIAGSTIDLLDEWTYTGGQTLTTSQSNNSLIVVGYTASSSSISTKNGDHYYNAEQRINTGTIWNNSTSADFTYFNKITLSSPVATLNATGTTLGTIRPDSLLFAGYGIYTIARSFTVEKYMGTPPDCGGQTTITATSPVIITLGQALSKEERVKIKNAVINNISITTPDGSYDITDCTLTGTSEGWNNHNLPPNTFYWVGNIAQDGTGTGTGNWSEGDNWSLYSGSHRTDAEPKGYHGDSYGCSPRPTDNVIFDEWSFNADKQRVTVDKSAYCDSMTWIGNVNFNTEFYINSVLSIGGSLVLQQGMTLFSTNYSSGINHIDFVTSRPNETIRTNGVTIGLAYLTFKAADKASGWKFLDDFKTNATLSYITFSRGTFDTNGYAFPNLYSFSGTGGSRNDRRLIITNSTLSFYVNSTNLFQYTGDLEAENSTIIMGNYGSFQPEAGAQYHNLEITQKRAESTFTIYRGKFNKITANANNIKFNDGSTDRIETDTLILANNANYTYKFSSGSTLQVNEAFYGSGTPCFQIYLQSTVETSPALFDIKRAAANYDQVFNTDAADTLLIDYANIHGIQAVGLGSSDYAQLYKGKHSPDAPRSSSTAWAYGSATANADTYNLNWAQMDAYTSGGSAPFGDENIILACKNLPYTLSSINFLPTPTTTFKWYKGALNNRDHPLGTAATQEVTQGGTYWLEVDYINGCLSKDDIIVVAQGSCPTIEAFSDQIVAYNDNTPPAPLTSIPSGGIGADGTGDNVVYSYQWYIWNTNTDTWAEIPSATASEYQPNSNLTEDTQYRVVVYDSETPDPNPGTSNTVTIRVLSVTATADQAIAPGTAPAALESAVTLTDGDGVYDYQWQVYNGADWVNVPSNGNSATYQPGSLTADTQYRVLVTEDGVTAISNEVTITIAVADIQNEVLCLDEFKTISLTTAILTAGTTAYWFPDIATAAAATDYANTSARDGVYTGNSKAITKNASAVEKFYIRIENNGATDWENPLPVILNVFLAPDSLVWTGAGTSGDWHKAANWIYPNNPDPTCIECQPYWIPTTCTDVLIPDNTNPYPDLTTTSTIYTSATRYATAGCNHIRFEHGGEVLRTDSLHYTEAYVEMKLQSNEWYMLSMPLKNTYTGDIYVDNPSPMLDGYKIEPMLFNIVNPETNTQTFTYSWTGSFNNADVEFQSGQGVAIWVDKIGTGYTEHPVATFQFPKSDIYYGYYYSDGTPTGNRVGPLDRTKKNRFIYEGADDKAPVDSRVQLSTSPVSASDMPVFVGNPFMAHLDFDKLCVDNPDQIYDEYKLAYGVNTGQNGKFNTFYTYKKIAGSYLSTEPTDAGALTNLIPPMQSFIVFSKTTSPILYANIATGTATNPGNVLRSATSNDSRLLEITAVRGAQKSKVLLLHLAGASPNYVPEEDSYTLFSESSLIPVMVYMRSADGYALDINAISEFDRTIPIGIRTSQKGDIRLKFAGMEKFDDRAKIYLHDTKTNRVIDLSSHDEYVFNKDEDALYVENRLFLSFDAVTGIHSAQVSSVSVQSLADQTVRIVSNDGCPLENIQVMDSQGRLLETKNVQESTYTFRVKAQGVYLVRITRKEGTEVKKIVIY